MPKPEAEEDFRNRGVGAVSGGKHASVQAPEIVAFLNRSAGAFSMIVQVVDIKKSR
jgi:hypothetical protein